MITNPLNPSFRYPASVGHEDAHPNVVKAVNQHTKGLVDLNQAIVSLKRQIDAKNRVVSGSGTTISGGSTTIINPQLFPGLGAVNDQTGNIAYTVQSSDSGALILIGDASPVAITLNSALFTPYFTTISNTGTSDTTITPSTGTINGAASLNLPAGSWVTVYFDNVNWWAESPGSDVGGVSQIIAGSNVTISPVSGIGAVTVSATTTAGGTKLPHTVTGSRTLGSIYQNTNGVDMYVSGYCTTSGGGTGALQAVIGTVTPTDVIWANDYTATLSSGHAGFDFYVPDGYFYELNVPGGYGSAVTGVGLWVEFW